MATKQKSSKNNLIKSQRLKPQVVGLFVLVFVGIGFLGYKIFTSSAATNISTPPVTGSVSGLVNPATVALPSQSDAVVANATAAFTAAAAGTSGFKAEPSLAKQAIGVMGLAKTTGSAQTLYTYWTFTGTDKASVYKQLVAGSKRCASGDGSSRNFTGCTNWHHTYRYWTVTTDGRCRISKLQSDTTYRTVLPTWSLASRNKSTPAFRTAVYASLERLKKHEQGHNDIAEGFINTTDLVVAKMSASNCNSLERAIYDAYSKTWTRIDAAEVKYDHDTDHGRKPSPAAW